MNITLQKSDPLRPQNDGIADLFHRSPTIFPLMLLGSSSCRVRNYVQVRKSRLGAALWEASTHCWGAPCSSQKMSHLSLLNFTPHCMTPAPAFSLQLR